MQFSPQFVLTFEMSVILIAVIALVYNLVQPFIVNTEEAFRWMPHLLGLWVIVLFYMCWHLAGTCLHLAQH